MKAELEPLIKQLTGNIGVYYQDLVTGNTFEYNATQPFIAASVIKLPILVAVFQEIEDGNLSRTDILTLTDADKVPSCGALNQMHSGLEITIMDLCKLMITLSDNTATNMLIRTLGIDKINTIIGAYGMEKTKLNRLLFDSQAQQRGLENYFSPAEIGALLEQLYSETVISKHVSREIVGILKEQKLNSKIPYLLPGNVAIAHKTGEDRGITHDVGIVYSDRPFILCFASNDTKVVPAEAAIKTIALHCYSMSIQE